MTTRKTIPCDVLSQITAVVLGSANIACIRILAALLIFNNNIKVIFYNNEDSDIFHPLGHDDKVLLLNFPHDTANISEILSGILQTRASVGGIVELRDYEHWENGLKKLDPEANLLFEMPNLSWEELQNTSLLSVFTGILHGWDQHCTDLLHGENEPLEELISHALSIEDPDDIERPLYLAKHLAQSLNPDDTIQRWLDEFLVTFQACEDAYTAAECLGGRIWKFIQPNTIAKFVQQKLVLIKNPLLIIRDSPHDTNGHRVYFIADDKLSEKAIEMAKERGIEHEDSGSSVWVAPAQEEAMIAIYRELLTEGH